MFKEKLIKNICCITGAIMILIVFFIFYGTVSYEKSFPFIIPIMMFEMAIAAFSLYWSMTRNGKTGLTHTMMIMVMMILAFIYIILETLATIAQNGNPTLALNVTTMIFLALFALSIAWCLFYPIYLDFFLNRKKKEELGTK